MKVRDCRRLALLGALLVVWAGTSPAAAHGILQGSSPPANVSLESPPRQVILVFNEPVEGAFSTATVLDGEGRRVSQSVATSEGGRRMTVALDKLPPGVYTVKWRVLSTVDGHTTGGSFVFGVAAQVPVEAGSPSVAAPGSLLVAARWMSFVATILLAGTAFFHYLVIRPGLSLPDSQRASMLVESADRLRALTMASALVLIVSLAAEFALQAARLLDTALTRVVAGGMLWSMLWGTKPGWSVIVRVMMVLLLLLPASAGGRILRMAGLIWFIVVGAVTVLLGGPAVFAGGIHIVLVVLVASVYGLVSAMMALILPKIPDLRIPQGAWAPPLAGVILLGGITISSHAVGSGPVAAVLDWVHLIAASVWVGGLVPLLIILWSASPVDRRQLARFLVPRFSTIAGISLGVLIITGLFSAWVHIPAPRALTLTTYGRALLVKILLVTPLIFLGALNRFVFRPRFQANTADASVQRGFQRSVSTEVILGAAVLLVVAVLTITPPATVTMPVAAGEPLVLAGVAGDLQVRLVIAPAVVGLNRFEATVTDDKGQQVAAVDRVILRLTKLDEDIDPATVIIQPQKSGPYVTQGGELGLPGWWEVEAVVRQKGSLDLSTTFPLLLGDPPNRASDPEALRLLDEVRATMRTVRSWREVEQIANGTGGVIVTHFEAIRPDRLRYRVSAGLEAVIVGSTRYQRDNRTSPWQEDTISPPLSLEGPFLQYIREVEGAARGRRARCDGEPCQVVLWRARESSAAFAAWMGLQTRRVYKLFMVAPAHYMTARPLDYNPPLEITRP